MQIIFSQQTRHENGHQPFSNYLFNFLLNVLDCKKKLIQAPCKSSFTVNDIFTV